MSPRANRSRLERAVRAAIDYYDVSGLTAEDPVQRTDVAKSHDEVGLLSRGTHRAATVQEVLQILVQGASERRGDEAFLAQLARLNGDRVVIEAVVNVGMDTEIARALTPVGMSHPLSATLLKRVHRAGTTCSWANVPEQPNLPGYDRLMALGVRSVVSTAFSVAGESYFLSLASRTKSDVSARDRTHIKRLSALLEHHLEQAWQADTLLYQAAHDPLTGLLNWQRFRSSLRDALAANDACTVAILDIAGFPSIVESARDAVRNALLVEVGGFLAGAMSFGQTASRLSGDVFGIYLPGIGTRDGAAAELERFLARFSDPFATHDRTGPERILLDARIGAAFKPSNGAGADELLIRAQAASVAAKPALAGRVAFFEPNLETRLPRPAIPANESERLSILRQFEILDTPPEPAFDRITRLAAKLLRASMASITFIDEDRQWFKSHLGLTVSDMPRDEAFCAYALDNEGVLVVHDAQADPRFCDNPLVVGEPNIRFYAGAPLVTAEGASVGAICVMDDRPREELSRADAETLLDLAGLVVDELGARRAIGYIDATTQLPNQSRLRKDLDAFINGMGREREPISVVVVETADPSRYEDLVRTLGDRYSDKFILATGQVVSEIIPARAKLYNLGRYRFAAVFSKRDLHDIETIIERIDARFAQPIPCADIHVATRATTGLASFPDDAQDGDGLIRAAISAVQNARNDHRTWARYDAARDGAYHRAFRLLSDLPAALASRNQLSMVYQPKIDLLTGQCIGAEALVRWKHPSMGAVPPSEFVALAEHTGTIRPLTDWILEDTFGQIAHWRAAGTVLTIGINVSMLDLDDSSFATRIKRLLARHGVPVDAIELELTESAQVVEHSIALRQLNELHEQGIEIAIDDFGTGQNAHSYLKRIPASTVKIDQSFIRSVATVARDQMIVGSMIELAHRFGYRVIAEGIETEPVREWLRLRDCDFGQSYLFARPLDADALERWLAARSDVTSPRPAART